MAMLADNNNNIIIIRFILLIFFYNVHFVSFLIIVFVINERMGFPITQYVYMPWHLGDPLGGRSGIFLFQ